MSESDGIPTVAWLGDTATIAGRTYRISSDLLHDAGFGPCPLDCEGHCAECGDPLHPDEYHPCGLDEQRCGLCCGCDQDRHQ